MKNIHLNSSIKYKNNKYQIKYLKVIFSLLRVWSLRKTKLKLKSWKKSIRTKSKK